MSRKWERMVAKNTKQLNKQRIKQGKKPLSGSDGVMIRGRSWFWPIVLLCVGIFCFIAFRGMYQDDAMYWVTGGSYILLSLFIFFLRRPYLKISGNTLKTRRFSGDRLLDANDIKLITLMKDAVVIESKTGKMRWTFSRYYHFMNMEQLSEKLKEFAKNHAVPVKDEGK